MKAILVIDMPLNCRGCDKLVRKGCLKGDYRKDERPKQCPLKEMPKEKEVPFADKLMFTTELLKEDMYNIGKAEGYNACLDEIVKGE